MIKAKDILNKDECWEALDCVEILAYLSSVYVSMDKCKLMMSVSSGLPDDVKEFAKDAMPKMIEEILAIARRCEEHRNSLLFTVVETDEEADDGEEQHAETGDME